MTGGDGAQLLPARVAAALGVDDPELVAVEPLGGGTGAATGRVDRLRVRASGREQTLVRKQVRPLGGGRHAEAARAPDHWAYWRREPLAYASGLLPAGPGFRAPRCFGTTADTVWLEDVTGPTPDAGAAATALGRWHARSRVPDVPWLAGHQLAQRLAVSALDWERVDADPRAERIWAARRALIAQLESVPHVLSHGDAGLANLRETRGDVVALDWGTLGVAPVGSDAAHVALSARIDVLPDHLAALAGAYAAPDVAIGYRTTIALVGASRVHWMLGAGIAVPDGYVDLLWELRPDGVR